MITDPQVLEFIAETQATYPDETNGAGIDENRRHYNAMCDVFRAPRPEGLQVEDRAVGGVPCRVYGPPSAVCVIYIHGGGFVVGGLDSHDDVCAEIADAAGLQVVSVDYRLAPEHRWPAQIRDVESVWQALDQPAVVVGDSAGAMLAASLCLSQRGQRQPLGQVLIYPGLGGDGSAASYRDNAEAPLLRTADLGGYQGALHGDDPVTDPLARPLHAAELDGLSPAFIVSADIDPLRDDASEYAVRLQQAGVRVQLRNEAQLPHGYLRARRTSDRARLSFQAIIAAIIRFANEGA
ncbi:alpha/beta hydrolase [Paracoccus saliphilus]|uniref:Acetyl esterase n=1 Tax=Paracoccus saliphilus TaxID=405559 RepID=A0AA45W4H1_9RHOB|nr:alpha/beta hydrolase [Paracoccus saliphilus]WCR04099.1 alpha/beta hydrolase [Paracoccus saliphilus]SIS84939.1 acetyl esterase [Paracoccus saliphilus]